MARRMNVNEINLRIDVVRADNTDSGYPNLMCFGRDVSNCPIVQSCSDYQACQAKYDDDWLSLFS